MSKIKLEDNCLLLIRKGSDLAKNISFEDLKVVITQMGLKNIGILMVDSFADIGKTPEHELNKLGYYQIGEVGKKFMEQERVKESNDN